MKLMALAFASFSSYCFAQSTPGNLFKQLLKNQQDLADAIAVGNKAVWSKHLHDSCLISIENGTIISKQKLIEELNPLPAGYVGRIQVIEPGLKVYGNTAVLSFINDEYLELFNQKIHTQYRQTDTWIKLNNQWKVISMQLFEIPKNPPPLKVDSNILKQYAGTFALSAERKCIVYVEDGKLYAKKGNKEAQELLAETENVFFRNGDGRVNVIFMKNDSGIYKMIERREGEDLVWQKFKD